MPNDDYFINLMPLGIEKAIKKYRLLTKINYQMKTDNIRFIGTHKEYDKINAEEI